MSLFRENKDESVLGESMTADVGGELELSAVIEEENVLESSLSNLMPEDIELKKEPPKKKRSAGAVIRRIMLIICFTVFVVCAVYLVWNLTDKARGKAQYEKIQNENEIFNNFFGESEEDDGAVSKLKNLKPARGILCLKDRLSAGDFIDTGYDSDSRIDEMRAKLTSLKESFPDLYGWIYIEGTAINYPVVQGNDNEFYLNASPYKLPLVNGSIFVDYRNDKTIMNNFNTVMYGHNLTGGGMFHDVQTLAENEEMFKDSLVYVYTLDGAFVYEPFAVYDTLANYQYFRTEFASTDEFVKFATEMETNSRYDKGTEFSATDRILTLSTCTNRNQDGRFTLQAKLVQVIT